MSREEQALLGPLQTVTGQVTTSSLFLPSTMARFPSSSPIPKDLPHFFLMSDQYQFKRYMNQAIPELACTAHQGTKPSH